MAEKGAEETMPTSSTDPDWPNPGLLTFRKLAVNRGQITTADEKRMERVITDQECLLKRNIHSQHFFNAVRNVKGLMLYHKARISDAIKTWKETLDSDPTNLNALQDLVTAYRKLSCSNEANQYETRIQQAIENASPNDKKLMLARCQVEQAHALNRDLHTKSWTGVDLRQKEVRAYEKALNIAGDIMDRPEYEGEKRDWLFFTGQSHERLCHAHFRSGDYDQYLASVGTAIDYLHRCLTMPPLSRIYEAEIWLTIGNTFARPLKEQLSFSRIPGKIIQNYAEQWEKPSDCYNRALRLDPENVSIWGKLGIYYFKQNDNSKAMANLNQSIDFADSLKPDDPMKRSSWIALLHRARIYMKYAQNPQNASENLQKAQCDASRAVDCNPSPHTLTVFGEVQNMMAQRVTSSAEADHLRNIALEKFYEASISQDGSGICNTHYKWAQCLKDSGDLSSAAESFKIAFETAPKSNGSFLIRLGYKLLCTMLENYTKLKRPAYLLKELTFWFIHIHNRCKEVKFDFSSLPWQYASEILYVLEHAINNIANLASNESDLKHGMLQKSIEDVKKWMENPKFHRCNRNFKGRFQALCGLHEVILGDPSQLSASKSPAESEPDSIPSLPRSPLTKLKGVDYDFCVISDEDSPKVDGWVKHLLLTGLECELFGLKGYYHKRDSKLGSLQYNAKALAMKGSAKILIVLSHNFDGADIWPVEIAQCLNEKSPENVILLLIDHVKMPIKLRAYRKFNYAVQANILELARYLMPVISPWDL